MSSLGVIRDALTLMLGAHQSIVVVGRANGGESAIELTKQLRPDVVVSCYGVDSGDISQLVNMTVDANRVRVVVLVSPTEDTRGQHALLASGVFALLDTSATGTDLISSICSAATMGDSMVTFMPQTMVNQLSIADHDSVLSPRQQEVLLHVAKGLSNRQISSQLGLTEGTVKRHLANIYAKLNVRSRTEAIHRALTDKLINAQAITSNGD
ncbi:response regulator transcription factor [Saccharopolyspora oryzae]|uniref:Response regulator transcription factor n=1 Tax=Saccharopolyspora oryzae TaxID=2997343 RepID=A0ABT4V6S8_9PSEU|nr:response regulator transcription factor [Saccharopolyspora oryzae]MDA3629653.1 response regulator transcription factor [Saccharopolyspora oryzae]